jgi:hypothetical protein
MPRAKQTSSKLNNLPQISLDSTASDQVLGGLNPQPLPPRNFSYLANYARYLSR